MYVGQSEENIREGMSVGCGRVTAGVPLKVSSVWYSVYPGSQRCSVCDLL